MIFEHHQKTVENLKEHYQRDPNAIALIVVGSVAREDALQESDLDFLLVVNEPLYAERSAQNAVLINAAQFCLQPCPEANGAFTAKSELRNIKDQGNEIARWTFHQAKIVFSKDTEVDSIISEIPHYPRQGREQRMASFYCQIFYHFSFFEFAYYSQNRYLIYETATKLILSAGRLILADNSMLYPNRKWFFNELRKAPEKPEGICEAMLDFLDEPNIVLGQRIIDLMQAFKSYPLPPEGMKARINREALLNLEEW